LGKKVDRVRGTKECQHIQVWVKSQLKSSPGKINWDEAPLLAPEDNPPPALAGVPLWGPREATAEFQRWHRKYGPKDLLGAIPPGAETADHLKPGRGKTPGYKGNDGVWFGRRKPLSGPGADTALEEVKKWGCDGANVGAMTRNLSVFDQDGKDPRISAGIDAIIKRHFPTVPERYRDNSPSRAFMLDGPRMSRRRLAYWRRDTPRPKRGTPALEYLGDGQYTNVAGLHPSGVLYKWRNGHPCETGLPKIDRSAADQVFADVKAYLEEEGYETADTGWAGDKSTADHSPSNGSATLRKPIGDPPLVAPSPSGGGARKGLDDDPSRHDEAGALRYMDLCPNSAERNPSRGDAVREVAAIKTSLGPNREEHRGRASDWHQHPDWPDNDDAEFDKIWDSITDSELGIEYLRSRCPELRDEAAQAMFADWPIPPEYCSDAPPLAPSGTDRVKRPPITVLTLDQIEKQASSEPPDFVEGTICDGGTSGWYGETNVGKSFVLLDLGLRVSLGWSWHGRSVERGGVIYIAGEGARGIMQRVAAWRKHHGEERTADARFAVIPDM